MNRVLTALSIALMVMAASCSKAPAPQQPRTQKGGETPAQPAVQAKGPSLTLVQPGAGAKDLFAPDLSNCEFKAGSWEYADGVLTRKGGGDIWTKDQYGDFVLDLEFKVDKGANSGVFIRCGDLADWINTTIEIQIHETGDGTKHGQCGAVYDIISPGKDVSKPAGEWNTMQITAKGPAIAVVMNGEKIVDINLDNWTQAGKNPQGTDNKFKYAYKDMPRSGRIGFQDHGQPVWFRNVRITPL